MTKIALDSYITGFIKAGNEHYQGFGQLAKELFSSAKTEGSGFMQGLQEKIKSEPLARRPVVGGLAGAGAVGAAGTPFLSRILGSLGIPSEHNNILIDPAKAEEATRIMHSLPHQAMDSLRTHPFKWIGASGLAGAGAGAIYAHGKEDKPKSVVETQAQSTPALPA